MFEIILFSLLIMLVSLVGVVSLWKRAGRVVERNLHFLVSLSAGVFLVIVYHLATETIEHAGLFIGLSAMLAGALCISVLFKLLPALHRHADHADDEAEHSIDPRRVLLSDALHNVGDGILLAASFVAGPVVGASAAMSIAIHELLQEVSEFFILREAGYSTRKALLYNFAVSGTILVGSIGGFLALDFFEILEGPLLGFAAGAFLVVVLGDLIPHSVRHSLRTSHYVRHIALFLLGVTLMSLVALFLGHE
ncbi:MAG: putative divalent heavy-metal cations transporter [Parcubacteria group bacterium Gr01-1014_56]|nr:MAG: putative divalent heavy-metal cations transporter [Parcubacteria group bacterium Gr01-1014_56]